MPRVCAALTASAVLFAAASAHAAPPPRITKGPWVERVGPTSAEVRVEVEPAAAISLDVGVGMPEGASGHHVVESDGAHELHSILLDRLTPASHYAYAAKLGLTTKAASFTTAPPEGSTAPFRFLVYGDNRTDEAAHASVVRAMTPSPGDFLIHTGDFVENGASLPQWQTFFDIEAPLLSSRPIVSAVGNHELVDGSGINYVKFFGPGGTTKPEHLDHTFRWANTRFFLLNSLSSFKSGVERVWLDNVLGEADNEKGIVWRIVVVHHGPWSSGPHGGNRRFHAAGLPALFKQHRVDIVFSGHDHVYERGVGGGDLPFVVTGGGGAPLYRLRTRIPESRKSESTRHFLEVEASTSMLEITAIRPDGSRIERCSLSKQAEGWFCGDPKPGPVDGGPPPLGEPEKAPPLSATSRCSCEVVGGGGDTRDLRPVAVLAFALPLVACRRRRRRY